MSLASLNAELLACRRCPRLVEWREHIACEKRRAYRDWNYWGKPVPGFGDPGARVMVVGLAPGAHGSNRTGRMFTGDASGNFLYPALYRAGFANQPKAVSPEDGLVLHDLYITAVCRCAPPENKPTLAEIRNCRPYLQSEIELLCPKIFVALGRIAFESVKFLLGAPDSWGFSHAAIYRFANFPSISPLFLVCSYHPSRQNTQTGRLTAEMFDAVWQDVAELLARL